MANHSHLETFWWCWWRYLCTWKGKHLFTSWGGMVLWPLINFTDYTTSILYRRYLVPKFLMTTLGLFTPQGRYSWLLCIVHYAKMHYIHNSVYLVMLLTASLHPRGPKLMIPHLHTTEEQCQPLPVFWRYFFDTHKSKADNNSNYTNR